MIVFADSSAVVKRYVDEPGAVEVRAVASLVVSVLIRVEVPAALWKKVRTGHLTADYAHVLVSDFEADWAAGAGTSPVFFPLGTSADLLRAAARLTAVHGLRAYDAVHLASALAARAVAAELTSFACFDRTLSHAATAEGFAGLPVS